MASNNYKAPPTLGKSSSYDNWLKEIAIWQTFTDITPKKQGSAIFLTLEGKAREAVLELEVKDINCDDGVKNVLAKLDTLYVRDKVQTAYEAYDRFEKFQRNSEMSMSDFMIEFERLLSKTKSFGTTMSSDLLAYRLLKAANIPEQQQHFARATVKELTYEEMKSQLKKNFGDSCSSDSDGSAMVKIEPTFEAHSEYDTMYGQFYGRRGSGRSRPYQRGSWWKRLPQRFWFS